jgi:hypothetical protein
VAILLTYATACVLLAGDAEARITWRAASARGFRNYTHSAPGFRALLIEGASEVQLALGWARTASNTSHSIAE